MKKRIISGAVMLLLLIPLIVIGKVPFAIGVGIISIIAYKEFLDLKKSHEKIPQPVALCGLLALLGMIYLTYVEYSLNFGISYKAIALAMLLVFLPVMIYSQKDKYLSKDAFYLFGVIILLGFTFNSLIVIRNISVWHLVYILLITTVTDIFAFGFGSLIGKNKLIPHVSPNKTWEGTIGGTVIGTFVGTMFYYNIIGPDLGILKIALFTLAICLVAQIGDLFFSKIKRENEIKDFSGLIPGHGGILDRLDSLLFAIIIYIFIFTVI